MVIQIIWDRIFSHFFGSVSFSFIKANNVKDFAIQYLFSFFLIFNVFGLQAKERNDDNEIKIITLVALISVVFGLFLAFYFDFSASGTIVLLSFFLFAVFSTVKRVK